MIPYTPLDVFTPADIYDTSDFVLGGISGPSNIPLKALLDQCNYLYNRLVRFEDVKLLTGSYTFDTADIRKLFAFHLTGNATFSLPDVTTLPVGFIIPIAAVITAIKALTVACSGSQKIKDGADDVSAMYMHDGERLHLVAAGTYWEISLADGNFKTAGYDMGVRKVPKNAYILQGQIINRADTPRLAAFALSLASGQSIVDDATWLSDPAGKPVYRGCFSTGNGTSNLRLPDERSLFSRMLDLGRGADVNRLHNYAGGFEEMSVEKHTHRYKRTRTDVVGSQYESNKLSSGSARGLYTGDAVNTEANAGVTDQQTQPKNIGKIPVILY